MGKQREITCDDCFFRQAELCAIPGNTPCPTFRAATPDRLLPPLQPVLVSKPAALRERPILAV